MSERSDIGAQLVSARRILGMTQHELGVRLGVSQSQVARWEARAYANVALKRVEGVARALGVETVARLPHAAEAVAPYRTGQTLPGTPIDRLMAELGVEPGQLARFCESRGIVELGLFGSVVRGELTGASDIDVLVRVSEQRSAGLGDLAEIADGLARLFGRPVDVVERRAVERSDNYIRRRAILEGLQNVYAA